MLVPLLDGPVAGRGFATDPLAMSRHGDRALGGAGPEHHLAVLRLSVGEGRGGGDKRDRKCGRETEFDDAIHLIGTLPGSESSA